MAVQLGRLGYRIVTDLKIEFYTEVPPTLGGLREQRQRWARSILHVGSRQKSSITMAQGARGLLWLPWAMINGTRRTIMLPLFLCSGVVAVYNPSVISLRQIAIVGGLLIGGHLLAVLIDSPSYAQAVFGHPLHAGLHPFQGVQTLRRL